jgi:hypothetical protein
MNTRPRTIQIYLPSGDPRGIRVAELTTSIVRVIEVPRALLDRFFGMPEAKQVGLYFLIGDDEDQDFPAVYIGQSGYVGGRLTEHHKQKEFWNRALVVVSLTNSLTQTHALFLEWCSIKYANQAGRYNVENGNGGSKPHTPAPLEADCWEIFDTSRTLIATMGQPVFEPLAKAKDTVTEEEVFYCKASSYDAVGQYTEEGLVVLKGSKARIKITPGMASTSFAKRRQGLIEDGTLKQEGNVYVFQRDVLFKSPSGASDIVAGASTNGWILWKTKNGKTLDELKRQPTGDQVAVSSMIQLA